MFESIVIFILFFVFSGLFGSSDDQKKVEQEKERKPLPPVEEDPELETDLANLRSLFEAVGFTFGERSDRQLRHVGAIRIEANDQWECALCERTPSLFRLHELVLLENPKSAHGFNTQWKWIGSLCVYCGSFHKDRKRPKIGLLGRLLEDNMNVRDFLATIGEERPDLGMRAKAAINAQRDFWERQIAAIEDENRKLLSERKTDPT